MSPWSRKEARPGTWDEGPRCLHLGPSSIRSAGRLAASPSSRAMATMRRLVAPGRMRCQGNEADFKPCPLALGDRSHEWVLEADITACFDESEHAAPLARLRRRVREKRILNQRTAVLLTAPSTHYASRSWPPSARARRDEWLPGEVRLAYGASRRRRRRRVWRQLRTASGPPIAPMRAPGQSSSTVPSSSTSARFIVSRQAAEHLCADLALDALEMALWRRTGAMSPASSAIGAQYLYPLHGPGSRRPAARPR